MKIKMDNIIAIRHKKRDLYVELARKGLDNLTEVEKQLLVNLSVDDDIVILLKNGHIFKILEK